MIDKSGILNVEKSAWRYMDFWKFESMLENKGCLYFHRSDMFEDSLEGEYSKVTLKDLEKEYLKLQGDTFVKNWKALFYTESD